MERVGISSRYRCHVRQIDSYSLDVATLASTRAQSRAEGNRVSRSPRSPSLSLSLVLSSSCIFSKTRDGDVLHSGRASEAPTVWPAPLFHRFLVPVIFSRYFPPKPVKADYCASSKNEQGIPLVPIHGRLNHVEGKS